MSHASYLLRFDDICPTMRWEMWEAIEHQLTLHDVRPILAVIPDNRDPKLMCDPPVPNFWERVRRWQDMGYTIALHGYQHLYVNRERGLMRLTPQSEFVGLSYEEQKDKLTKAAAIFEREKVRIDAWVAPSHSFDLITLKVLAELGVKMVSDGLWPRPFVGKDGMFWVPQQLWEFRRKPAGVWTVCNHHNDWTQDMLEAFQRDMASFGPLMTDVASVTRAYADRSMTFSDEISARTDLMWNHRILPALRRVKRSLFTAASRT